MEEWLNGLEALLWRAVFTRRYYFQLHHAELSQKDSIPYLKRTVLAILDQHKLCGPQVISNIFYVILGSRVNMLS